MAARKVCIFVNTLHVQSKYIILMRINVVYTRVFRIYRYDYLPRLYIIFKLAIEKYGYDYHFVRTSTNVK